MKGGGGGIFCSSQFRETVLDDGSRLKGICSSECCRPFTCLCTCSFSCIHHQQGVVFNIFLLGTKVNFVLRFRSQRGLTTHVITVCLTACGRSSRRRYYFCVAYMKSISLHFTMDIHTIKRSGIYDYISLTQKTNHI